mgnify:CR=1 FL=1
MINLPLTFTITGPIPTKKNIVNFGKGRFYRPAEYHRWVRNAILELRSQKVKSGLEYPIKPERVLFKFFITRSKDADNLLGTVFDLFQESGIVQNDKNITHGQFAVEKSDKEEYCEVTFVL